MEGTLRRKKVAKRSYPWLPAAGAAVTLPSSSSSSSSSQDEDIPAAKMPRLLVPFPATAEEDATKTASPDAEDNIPPADPDADADPLTAMPSNASATSGPPSFSTLENDANLTHEAESNVQRMHNSGNECRKDWAAIVAMAPVPVPTNKKHNSGKEKCKREWAAMAPVPVPFPVPTNMHSSGWYPGSIYRTTAGFTGMRTSDQVNILQIRNGMNGYSGAVALPVELGQSKSPCSYGWSPRGGTWHPSIAQATGVTSLTGLRTADQGGVQETQHNHSMNWYASLALDPSQTTTSQCGNRLHKTVGIPVDRATGHTDRKTEEEGDIDWTTERKGKWTADEDDKLIRAAGKYALTRWKAIAALIPGRTKRQCWNRWQHALDPSIVRISGRAGTWLTEEDDKLVSAVEKHNGKNWVEIAALVPGRTKRQCMDRWHKVLDTSAY
jgi:hypothetical protein